MELLARPRLDLFRLAWGALCLALWWTALELAQHRSANPAVFGRWSPAWFVLLAGASATASFASAGLLPRIYPRFRAARGPLARSALLTALLCLGSLEILFRLDFLGASYHEETARYLRETLPDPELNYRHRPGFETRYQGYDVRFNELGLREPPLAGLVPSETRIVILGDSVAFGWGVAEEDTFGSQLERQLGGGARTVNTGVCSYNTVQQLRFLERSGSRLQPDLVFLLYVENDVKPFIPVERQASMVAVRGRPGRLADWLLARSWTYRVGYHLSQPLLAGEPLDPNSEGYRASMAALAELAELSQSLGGKLAVALYRMSGRPASDRLLVDIEAVGARCGFPVADTLPWFEGRDLRRLTNSVTDTHPNAEGHAVLARGAARFLLAHDLLSKPAR